MLVKRPKAPVIELPHGGGQAATRLFCFERQSISFGNEAGLV